MVSGVNENAEGRGASERTDGRVLELSVRCDACSTAFAVLAGALEEGCGDDVVLRLVSESMELLRDISGVYEDEWNKVEA